MPLNERVSIRRAMRPFRNEDGNVPTIIIRKALADPEVRKYLIECSTDNAVEFIENATKNGKPPNNSKVLDSHILSDNLAVERRYLEDFEDAVWLALDDEVLVNSGSKYLDRKRTDKIPVSRLQRYFNGIRVSPSGLFFLGCRDDSGFDVKLNEGRGFYFPTLEDYCGAMVAIYDRFSADEREKIPEGKRDYIEQQAERIKNSRQSARA